MITTSGPPNAEIARVFREVADRLELNRANQFRIRAYRNAARTVEDSTRSVSSIARTTPNELEELPGIGADLAGKIREIVRTGTLPMLGTLERHAPKGATELMHVPGIGPRKARVLAQRLHVRSLGGLKRATRPSTTSRSVRHTPQTDTRRTPLESPSLHCFGNTSANTVSIPGSWATASAAKCSDPVVKLDNRHLAPDQSGGPGPA